MIFDDNTKLLYQFDPKRTFPHEIVVARSREVEISDGLKIYLESGISDEEWDKLLEYCFEILPKYDSNGNMAFVSDRFFNTFRFRTKADAMRFKISIDMT